MTSKIVDFDPSKGQAFQGDVAMVPVPAEIAIDTSDEIKPANGRLILQEGEVTGHHHAIHLEPASGRSAAFKRDNVVSAAPYDGASPGLRARLTGARRAKTGTARMFRDRTAIDAMVAAGILARADLCVGFLVVEGGPVVVRHEEHDGIRLPEGRFYIGRQVESAGADERRVAD